MSSPIGLFPWLIVVVCGLSVLVILPVWVATLVWVYRDAERLGKSGILVALLVGLIMWPVGLLVWLILRGDWAKAAGVTGTAAPPRACPRCGRALASDTAHGMCPACLLQQATGSDSGAPNPSTFTPPGVAELAPLFPQLEILELLGRGGMGAVYKARQPGLDRFVALKVLPVTPGADPMFAERFQREARALASLNHPHIVNVYDFGQTPTLSWFLMEYVDGVNLRQLERTSRLSPREALAIVPQVCEALQFAHDRGIVHRDIKPENILVDKQGRVKIADFGLAKLMRPDAGGIALTETRHAVGTLQYMAPEQVEKPQSVDHRADIYSLGVVFYEMLTGELPIGRFPSPSQRVQVDVRLDEVVLKALEKEPDRRYQQASAFKTNVETFATAPGQAAPVLPPVAASVSPSTSPVPSPGQRAGQFMAWVLYVTAGLIALWPVIGLIMDFNDRGHVARFAGCWVIAAGLVALGRVLQLWATPANVAPRKSRVWVWILVIVLTVPVFLVGLALALLFVSPASRSIPITAVEPPGLNSFQLVFQLKDGTDGNTYTHPVPITLGGARITAYTDIFQLGTNQMNVAGSVERHRNGVYQVVVMWRLPRTAIEERRLTLLLQPGQMEKLQLYGDGILSVSIRE